MLVNAIPMGGKRIGPGCPVYVIAEAGVNHNGDLDLALALVDAAARAGADAVKFQTFQAEALVSPFALKAGYQSRNVGEAGSQLDLLKALELPLEAFRSIQRRCVQAGIQFLSTPFDLASALFLRELGAPALKIGSGELTHLPLLAELAALDRPILLSTGMATLEEVGAALACLRDHGGPQVALLHCLSTYPAPPDEYNLRAITTLARAFGVPVGLSDHTEGCEVALGAVALGAVLVEKHFTLDRALPGPDHPASMDPAALADLIRRLRLLESALGDGVKRPMPSELNTRDVARRSVVLARALPRGRSLEPGDLALKRPGTGLPPTLLEALMGRVLVRDLPDGAVLAWEDLEGGTP